METPLLHGVLVVEIIEGKDLPNVDFSLFRRKKDVSDPYVTLDVHVKGKKTTRLAKTRVIDNNLNPKWRETFRLELVHNVETLHFSVKDSDFLDTVDHMGYLNIRGVDVANGEEISGWHPLVGKKGKQKGYLNVKINFTPASDAADTNEVPDVAFPARSGCRVRLYQDAMTPAVPPLTDIVTKNGEPYIPPQNWCDTFDAISNAQRLVYVWGWSVHTDLVLVRGSANDEDGGEDKRKDVTLGELLKRKASEGVRVLVMVWNEALSSNLYPPGLMGVGDEKTVSYFAGTGVEVINAPRKKGKGKVGEYIFVGTAYTHHQKGVICDTAVEEDDTKRRLVAFMGGIDLTGGRYDSPSHELHKTISTDEHKNDMYNNITVSSAKCGPREPWHDVHMYVEGGAAHDLLQNFVERWQRQGKDKVGRILSVTDRDFVMDWTTPDEDAWNVQFFRSISSDSATFDPNIIERLLTEKGRVYERSIQAAYVHHIRRAKRFIYMENQYFIGSSFAWEKTGKAKAPNLVPMELAMRCVRAIEAGEDFRIYVVLPMFSEGDPTSAAVQEILHWQYYTIKMMYKRIADALAKAGSDAHPTDYLCFFCLGKKESPEDVPSDLPAPKPGSVAEKCRENLRYPIYLHSKMAIFDDEYVIVGSANINERSLSGKRDTEMCLGCWQPAYTKETAGEGEVEGDVRTFRLALWAEHCGAHTEEHLSPTSIECVTAMKELGKTNMDNYVSGPVGRTESHLLEYPLSVSKDGVVTARSDCETFPDLGGSITGKDSGFLPNTLTC